MSDRLIRQVAPCVVTHNMALGGAQIAILRMLLALPDLARERTTLYCQSNDRPVLDKAIEKHNFSIGAVTNVAPADPSCWLLNYGDIRELPQRPTSLILHSWDDEGWRYVTKAYGSMRGMTVAGVSRQVVERYQGWMKENGHVCAGVLPPPVTEFALAGGLGGVLGGDGLESGGLAGAGLPGLERIVVAWMGRPLESKGLFSLPYLLKLDKRLVIRAWTGAETAGLPYTRKMQAQAMSKLLELAASLGVQDRLDIRPLDFDPLAYRHRLQGAHVLLGNSRKEGFLLTAAEALSCGLPVVVTRTCGITDYIQPGVNGQLIDWDDDPRKLARASWKAILKAVKLNPFACLQSAETLSLAARYRQAHGATLARLLHTGLAEPEARVTVGLRVHMGTRREFLDEAVSSLAMQSYRRFRTALLVDGPWSFGQGLAERYGLPLICTGLSPDITHCSWLHRTAAAACGTEFYKPLDYDDQLLPDYLSRAVAAMDARKLDVYGCRLMSLENGEYAPRAWPHKALETMFTGNSDDNMLPHSSVLLRTATLLKAGNYQERAVGLGADDYHVWQRIFKCGGKFWRDDEARNVVYRIHEKNSLKVRRARYGHSNAARKLLAGATAASLALGATLGPAQGADERPQLKKPQAQIDKNKASDGGTGGAQTPPPPHS